MNGCSGTWGIEKSNGRYEGRSITCFFVDNFSENMSKICRLKWFFYHTLKPIFFIFRFVKDILRMTLLIFGDEVVCEGT